MGGLNRRLEKTQEGISELDDRTIEIIQSKQQNEHSLKK